MPLLGEDKTIPATRNVFEYEGALSHYYPAKPPVITVKLWHSKIASNFIDNYCKH